MKYRIIAFLIALCLYALVHYNTAHASEVALTNDSSAFPAASEPKSAAPSGSSMPAEMQHSGDSESNANDENGHTDQLTASNHPEQHSVNRLSKAVSALTQTVTGTGQALTDTTDQAVSGTADIVTQVVSDAGYTVNEAANDTAETANNVTALTEDVIHQTGQLVSGQPVNLKNTISSVSSAVQGTVQDTLDTTGHAVGNTVHLTSHTVNNTAATADAAVHSTLHTVGQTLDQVVQTADTVVEAVPEILPNPITEPPATPGLPEVEVPPIIPNPSVPVKSSPDAKPDNGASEDRPDVRPTPAPVASAVNVPSQAKEAADPEKQPVQLLPLTDRTEIPADTAVRPDPSRITLPVINDPTNADVDSLSGLPVVKPNIDIVEAQTGGIAASTGLLPDQKKAEGPAAAKTVLQAAPSSDDQLPLADPFSPSDLPFPWDWNSAIIPVPTASAAGNAQLSSGSGTSGPAPSALPVDERAGNFYRQPVWVYAASSDRGGSQWMNAPPGQPPQYAPYFNGHDVSN